MPRPLAKWHRCTSDAVVGHVPNAPQAWRANAPRRLSRGPAVIGPVDAPLLLGRGWVRVPSGEERPARGGQRRPGVYWPRWPRAQAPAPRRIPPYPLREAKFLIMLEHKANNTSGALTSGALQDNARRKVGATSNERWPTWGFEHPRAFNPMTTPCLQTTLTPSSNLMPSNTPKSLNMSLKAPDHPGAEPSAFRAQVGEPEQRGPAKRGQATRRPSAAGKGQLTLRRTPRDSSCRYPRR